MTSGDKAPTGHLPIQKNPKDSDDGLLDSLGKAIADPIKTGAEDEELKNDGAAPVRPGA